MKHFILLFLVLTLLAFHDSKTDVEVVPETTEELTEPNTDSLAQIDLLTLERFLEDMANRESNNNHRVVNRFGMMGKYQFSPRTVETLGFSVSREEFLNNAALQDSVMKTYLRTNYQILKHIIDEYNGKEFKGIIVTPSGVLAAAHLGGAGNVKKFFSDDDWNGRTDANGTSLRMYMEQFGGYQLGDLM